MTTPFFHGRMKIKLYWHCYLANNWRGVCAEQLAIASGAGLLKKSESLTVGVIGSAQEKDEFRQMLILPEGSTWLQFRYFGTEPKQYEFPTLQILWEDAINLRAKNEDAALLYWHTKGTSYEVDKRKRWREVLNEETLNKWQVLYDAMLRGYNVAGPNHLEATPQMNRHFGGNFWMAQSAYVARLKRPRQLRTRFDAERWICTGDPSVLPQDFIGHE